jgi:hypothetical protein
MALIYSPKHISILCELELSPQAHKRLLERFKQSPFYQHGQKGLGWFLKDIMPYQEYIQKASMFNRKIHLRISLNNGQPLSTLHIYLGLVKKELEKYTE